MTEQTKTSWQYHPLNGQEALKWIFADAWQKLQQYDLFQTHLSYHNPTYKLKLEIQAYDASAEGATNSASVSSGATLVTIADELPKNRLRMVDLDVASDVPLKEPDRARELLDEGRYKVVSDSGVLVDKKFKKEKK